jgi:hypothetical protein
MSAPSQAELETALLDLRQSAESLKTYAPERVERLRLAIRSRLDIVRGTTGLRADGQEKSALIVRQCADVLECIERAERYPAQLGARADVLYRSARLARLARDLLARVGSPALH